MEAGQVDRPRAVDCSQGTVTLVSSKCRAPDLGREARAQENWLHLQLILSQCAIHWRKPVVWRVVLVCVIALSEPLLAECYLNVGRRHLIGSLSSLVDLVLQYLPDIIIIIILVY